MLYTNPSTIKQMRAAPQKLATLAGQLPLWLAWYNSNPPAAASYAPWATYHIWQPTPSAVGHLYGMESGNVDTDTWNGTLEELIAFVNKIVIPTPLTLEERLAIVEQKLKDVEQKLIDHGW
jgi:GH25 family lysozyme M1 (1,4-beta-N-acetylmuramidase)